MLSYYPTYADLDYKYVPQEWCDAMCFESCCIESASQETRCRFSAITKFPPNLKSNTCVQANREDIDETFQSAYKAFHNTETALVKVHNDILTAIDNNNTVILLLLDLLPPLIL